MGIPTLAWLSYFLAYGGVQKERSFGTCWFSAEGWERVVGVVRGFNFCVRGTPPPQEVRDGWLAAVNSVKDFPKRRAQRAGHGTQLAEKGRVGQ